MSRPWRRMLPMCACVFGGLLVALSLRAEDAPAPPTSEKPAADSSAPGTATNEPAVPAEKHLLAFKFRIDQEVRYDVQSDMQMTTNFSGAMEIATNKSESRRSYKVTQVTPTGEGELQLAIERVHMIAWFDNGVTKTRPIEFQSDDPTKRPPQFAHIMATVGRPQATIRFSASGRPLKVESIDRSPPANPAPTTAGAETEENAAGSRKQAAMAADSSHENYLIPLPEQPVAVGETWKERFDIIARDHPDNLPVRVTMQRAYKLTEVKDGLATIEFRTVILTPIQNPAVSAQLMQRETSGKFVFDISQGLIVSRESGCDKTVVDGLGAKSSSRAVSKYRENLVSVTATAERDATADTVKQQ